MNLKKALLLGLIGIPIGVFIADTIVVADSLWQNGWNTGAFYPVTPALISQTGNEMRAVLLQFILSGVIGFCFSAGTVIWKIEKWSLAKQTVCYFLLLSIVMFPIAYVCNWMGDTTASVVRFVLIFLGIYIIFWFSFHYFLARKVRSINKKLNENR